MFKRILKIAGLFILDAALSAFVIGGIIGLFHVLPNVAHDVLYAILMTISILLLKVIGQFFRGELTIIFQTLITKHKLKKEIRKTSI